MCGQLEYVFDFTHIKVPRFEADIAKLKSHREDIRQIFSELMLADILGHKEQAAP